MARPTVSEDEFVKLFLRYRSPQAVANVLGVHVRSVLARRAAIEARCGIELKSQDHRRKPVHYGVEDHPAIHHLDVENGVVLIGSDAHYWPGIISAAHIGFVQFCKEMQPAAVILNGDVVDGARVSRHPAIGWEDPPSLQQELETCQQRLGEIEDACKNVKKIWTLGNHDGRYDTKLAAVAPQFAGVKGTQLKDHFPMWTPTLSCWINGDVVVKHRWKNGVHAVYNNTVYSGKSMVTGHLHSLKVTPFTDYGGTRYGVDTGCLAPVYGPQTANYTETNPVNWRSGFVVLTFHKGELLYPELVHVRSESEIEFRGKVHTIEPT